MKNTWRKLSSKHSIILLWLLEAGFILRTCLKQYGDVICFGYTHFNHVSYNNENWRFHKENNSGHCWRLFWLVVAIIAVDLVAADSASPADRFAACAAAVAVNVIIIVVCTLTQWVNCHLSTLLGLANNERSENIITN